MKKTLLLTAMTAALGFASVPAVASPITLEYANFNIQEGSVVGSLANLITADSIGGSYTELVTTNNTGGFASAAFVNFTGFSLVGSSTPIASQLGNFGSGGYSLYGTFESTGQVISGTNFMGVTGNFKLYLDANQNTVKTLTNAFTTATRTNTSDDVQLLSSTVLSYGLGSITDPKAFEFLFDPSSLTTAGSAYFVAPTTFYVQSVARGNVVNLGGAPNTTYNVSGQMDLSFQNTVPEPASLALVGLGLLGLAASRRRKSV